MLQTTTSLSGSFGPRFDDHMKGCWWSSKDGVKHLKEGRDGGRDGGRDEGMGWRGSRKVNEYQTACSLC